MLCPALIISAALAGFAPATLVRAAGSGNDFLATLLGRLHRQGESFACFIRQYDDVHLAAHPRQRVTFVKALVDAYFRESALAPGSGSYIHVPSHPCLQFSRPQ